MPRLPNAALVAASWFFSGACAGPTTDTPAVEDVGSLGDISAADASPDSGPAPADASSDTVEDPEAGSPATPPDWGPPKPPALECAIALVPQFELLAAPHLKPCVKCHNSVIPGGFMPGGGPQWLNPYKPSDTVTALVLTDLLDPRDPARSAFILKPLEEWDGGVDHSGDGFFLFESAEYADLLEFATAAAPCAASPR